MTGSNDVDEFLARCDDVIDDWTGSYDSASWSSDGSHEYDTGGEYFGVDRWAAQSSMRQYADTDDRPQPHVIDMLTTTQVAVDPLRFGPTRHGATALSLLRLLGIGTEEADGRLHEYVNSLGVLTAWIVTTHGENLSRAYRSLIRRVKQFVGAHGGECSCQVSYVDDISSTNGRRTLAVRVIPLDTGRVDEWRRLAQRAFAQGLPPEDGIGPDPIQSVDDSRTARPNRTGRSAQDSPYGPPARRRQR